MNHLKQIAARLPEYGLDAMLLNSEPGEYYAVGFHGEGNVVVTAQGCFYFTDSRYIEAANHLITGAEIAMTGRRVKRIVVADGTITEFDDTTYSAGDAIGYGVTMSANPSDLINGATSVEYIAKVATASLSK